MGQPHRTVRPSIRRTLPRRRGAAPPVKPMGARRLLGLGVASVVVLVVMFVVTAIPRRSVENELRAEATARDSAPSVQVTTVRRAPAGSTLVLPGTIQALHESAIYARVTGYVKRWQSDIGSLVRSGQLLAEIDAPELDHGVEQAQSQLSQTRAALGLAKADLERWRALARDSAVTSQELDQKRAAFDAATANTGASEANLRRLVQTRQYTRVTAPFTGVVTARNVDIGSLITPAGATSAPARRDDGRRRRGRHVPHRADGHRAHLPHRARIVRHVHSSRTRGEGERSRHSGPRLRRARGAHVACARRVVADAADGSGHPEQGFRPLARDVAPRRRSTSRASRRRFSCRRARSSSDRTACR